MPEGKPQQTLGDYVTIALSPALIMALVGSLVFFLLEVLYVGQYTGRLQWTLFFFVFGIVLIARISIEQSGGRAAFFGLALGGAVFVALQSFVKYPEDSPTASFGWAINLGLMALSWWCAHRLTWDCTYIDDSVDASGKGVLEAAGIDQAQAEEADSKTEDDKAGKDSSPGLFGWWDRYSSYREKQLRKPHTPGVWVVYFSLAALPLFGLGQALIPAAEEGRRRYAFWLMVCYVASGLGLLLTTSYLGLRRYLRQRKLQMPRAMTGVWLMLGGALVVLMLLIGALLPRPYGEYQIINFSKAGSKLLKVSRFAIKRDSAAEGQEGKSSSDTSRSDDPAGDGSGKKPGDKGQAESQSGGKPSQGQGQGKGGSSSSGKSSGEKGSNSGNQKGKSGSDRNDKQSSDRDSSKSNSDSRGDRDQNDNDQNSDKKNDDDAQQGKSNKQNDQDQSEKKRPGGSPVREKDAKNQAQSKTGQNKSSTPPNSPSPSILPSLGALATFLKWIVFGILALVVLFFLLRSGLQFLANFTNWAKQLLAALDAWWKGLFGRKRPAGEAAADVSSPKPRPRPFSAFSNPFTDGTASQFSPDEIATYTFEALQAWAWERDLGRGPEETPLEFAERLGGEVPALESEARGLAGMYARVAYARGRLAPSSLKMLGQFWQRLESVAERPLSA